MVNVLRIKSVGFKRISDRLVKIETVASGPFRRLSDDIILDVIQPMRDWDRRKFAGRSGFVSWPRLAWPTFIFSRVTFRKSQKFRTFRQIRRYQFGVRLGGAEQTMGALPNMDTQTLWRSLWERDHPNFRMIRTGTSIRWGTTVPYAEKVRSGRSQSYSLGPKEISNFEQRVEKPKPRAQAGKRERRARRIFRDSKGHDLQWRPYYVLLNWAKKTYPRSKKIPKRDWITKYPRKIIGMSAEILFAQIRRQIALERGIT